jgi:hypothetical protein
MFIAAQIGVVSGDPVYAICAQSKLKGNSPRPEVTPNCLGQLFSLS